MTDTIASAISLRNSIGECTFCYCAGTLPGMVHPGSESEHRRTRLEALVAEGKPQIQKGDIAAFARKHGLDATYLSQLLNRHRSFGERAARNIEEKAGLPRRWFEVAGTIEKVSLPRGATPVIAWRNAEDLTDEIDPYVFVPRIEVRASAGNGKPIVEQAHTEERQPQAFRADWIRLKGWKAANLVCIFADGNSMSPRIEDGDCLLVDRAQTQVLDGKIYALAWDHEMRVKRLYKRVGGGLIVHSDNEREHPRFELSAEQLQHVVIVGRVVWIGGDV